MIEPRLIFARTSDYTNVHKHTRPTVTVFIYSFFFLFFCCVLFSVKRDDYLMTFLFQYLSIIPSILRLFFYCFAIFIGCGRIKKSNVFFSVCLFNIRLYHRHPLLIVMFWCTQANGHSRANTAT